MTYNNSVQHQKALVLISLGFLLFILGDGEFTGSVSLPLVGIVLHDPKWLKIFAWGALLWSFWRFWVNNDIRSQLRIEAGRQLEKVCREANLETKRRIIELADIRARGTEEITEHYFLKLHGQAPIEDWFEWTVSLHVERGVEERSGQVGMSGAFNGPEQQKIKWKMIWRAFFRGNAFADYIWPILLFVSVIVLSLCEVVWLKDGEVSDAENSEVSCVFCSEERGIVVEQLLLCVGGDEESDV